MSDTTRYELSIIPHIDSSSSLDAHVPDKQDTLQTQLTTEVDKYLQEVTEKQQMDVNYFDGQHVATNTISHQQKVDSVELGKDEILELINHNTSEKSETNIEHYIRYNDELEMIPKESDEDLPVTAKGDGDEVDIIPYIPGDSEDEQFNTAIDDTSDDPRM